jgi:L-lysine exporter family protein LysE/ArgO
MPPQMAIGSVLFGFGFGLSLILSLGPQNLCLLRAGVTRNQPLAAATIAYLSEFVLVSIGIGGLGQLLAEQPLALSALRAAGVAFLAWCGVRTLMQLQQPREGRVVPRPGATVTSILAATWLNPLVYIETVLLVGMLAAAYGGGTKLGFAAGFLVASAVKFYGWSLLGILFSTWAGRPSILRRFDMVSSLVVLTIAGLLAADLATR